MWSAPCRPKGRRYILAVLLCLLISGAEGATWAQQTGAIEFVARVVPTDGRPEPVREMTFFLLRKSFADIQKEIEESEPKPNEDKFIEGLEVSPELKDWMKRKKQLELSGPEFTRKVKPEDAQGVPEFYEAYMKRNGPDVSVGFPLPKFRQVDPKKEPAKYEKLRDEYEKQIRLYMEKNPFTIEGIEVYLDAINPGQRWAQQEIEYRRRLRRRVLEASQSTYLAAKTDTDLEGRGWFSGVAPGEYWLSTLETEALAGDVRLRWDLLVVVRPGQVTRLELSNLNAAERARPTK